MRRWANLIAHGKHGLLLLLRQLRSVLLNYDLLLNNRLAILLVLLVLVHDVRSGVEILLALIAPCTFNFEALVIRGRSEPTSLSHSPEVVIGEAECPILESTLIIVLTLIGLCTLSFLELRLRDDTISPPNLTLVILPVDMGADHSCQVRRLVGPGTSEVATTCDLLGSSVVLSPINLYHWCSLRVSALIWPR